MRIWCKILPFFLVEWLARKHCERFQYDLGKYGKKIIVSPFKGVIFILRDWR